MIKLNEKLNDLICNLLTSTLILTPKNSLSCRAATEALASTSSS